MSEFNHNIGPPESTPLTQSPKPKKVKLTAKVRRGLGRVYSLITAAFDDSKPPAPSIVKGWKKSEEAEFNAALAWIEQNERE